MRFSEFMQSWLYDADGYYSSYKEIGKKGDFFTAVSVSKFFGGSIANYIYRLIKEKKLSKNSYIIEIGAHRGYLLADIVQFLYTFDKELIKSLNFAIIEPYNNLQKIQREYFYQSFGNEVKFEQFKSLKDIKVNEAFVVANEIFDAFSCELYYKEKMAFVENFHIDFKKSSDDIKNIATKYAIKKGEIAIGYERFANDMAKAFKKVRFVTFDYGDLVPRNDFSIRVYYNHQVFPLFDKNLSLQDVYKKSDITYDVNFSHLIDSFKSAGFKKEAYKTQLAALVDFGIINLLEEVEKRVGFRAYKQELEKVKILINPSMMGERFKMVEFIK
jgi:SAM-dependent MidA family methyltransferase